MAGINSGRFPATFELKIKEQLVKSASIILLIYTFYRLDAGPKQSSLVPGDFVQGEDP
jgi:hypothetical protein